MRELALHILDLVQNSITAGAKTITLDIHVESPSDCLTISIEDDGCGMSEAVIEKVVDPFYTTRTTRNVGLGVPMFKANAEMCGGGFTIDSEVAVGTKVRAWFTRSHIDRPPLGNMATTIVGIVLSLDHCNLVYRHRVDGEQFDLSTQEMRELLGEDVLLSDVEVLQWVRSYVDEGLKELGVIE